MSAAEAPVRWGVAGCGWVTRDFVAPAIAASANGTLAAVFDPSPAAMAALPAPGARRHGSLDDLLGGELDAVYVAAPNDRHAELTGACAARGLHVLCEKPMATTLADAEGMVAACARAGVLYATAFNQRFHGAHRRLRGMIAGGALGTVTAVRIHYACWLPEWWRDGDWHLDPLRAGGGALFDLAPHGLDLAQHLLDDEIEAVACLGQSRVHRMPVEDGAALVARMRGGALLSMLVAYNTPETLPRRTLEVIGTGGSAVATDTMGQDAGGTLEVVDARSGRRAAVPIAPEDDRDPFAAQVEAFADAVRGRAPLTVAPARDLVTMRALLDAREALA